MRPQMHSGGACRDCTVDRSDECVDDIVGHCGTATYQGDGYCDAENNNAGCDWDGGDCCGADASNIYCKSGDACQCVFAPCGGGVSGDSGGGVSGAVAVVMMAVVIDCSCLGDSMKAGSSLLVVHSS